VAHLASDAHLTQMLARFSKADVLKKARKYGNEIFVQFIFNAKFGNKLNTAINRLCYTKEVTEYNTGNQSGFSMVKLTYEQVQVRVPAHEPMLKP
jgi:hypothetical protein